MATTRSTWQRRAIKAVFGDVGRPLSAREVEAITKKRAHGVGTATIYRAINALVGEGWLVPVEIPAEPTRYEIAGLRHHHHFYCRCCRRVYDVENCSVSIEKLAPSGFETEAHEIIFYGRCRECLRN